MEVDTMLSAAGGAIGGVSIAGAVAKWAVARALGDLDGLNRSVAGIRESLAEIRVRLEQLSRHEEILADHAKKHAYLEGKGCKNYEKR